MKKRLLSTVLFATFALTLGCSNQDSGQPAVGSISVPPKSGSDTPKPGGAAAAKKLPDLSSKD